MARPIDLSIVIPAFNEQHRLEDTLREIEDYLRTRAGRSEVIVVDDGSRDRTSELVQEMEERLGELHLVRLPENRGKGYAVRTGVANARGRLILFTDADGATPISEVERLERELTNGSDVAIGSRAIDSPETHVDARLHRRLIGRGFHLLVKLLAIRGFVDTQCGFKLFRARAAHELFARMRVNGFCFDVELLLIAQHLGYRVAEVPVNWTHKPGSRINLALDSSRMALDLFLIRGRLLQGEYNETHLRPIYADGAEPGTRSLAAGR